MRIIEHGAHRVSVDLEALFTWEDTRHALAFMDSLEYKNSMKLLVLGNGRVPSLVKRKRLSSERAWGTSPLKAMDALRWCTPKNPGLTIWPIC